MTFIAVFGFFIFLYSYYVSRAKKIWIQERFLSSREKKANTPADLFKDLLIKLSSLAMPKHEKDLLKTKQNLVYANYRNDSDISIYFGVRTLLTILFSLLFVLLLIITGKADSKHLIQTIFPLAAGYYLPVYILSATVKNRNKKIFRELPDMIDLLIICIEAGLGFEAALLRISTELEQTAPVLSSEFARYFFESKSGLPRNRALANLKERNSEDGLRSVVDVLMQSVRFGTDIAAALRVHSKDMRVRRRQIAEEKGAKVATKLTLPLIVLILPVLLIIILGPAAVQLFYRMSGAFF